MKFLFMMAAPICKTCIHYCPPPDGRFDSEFSGCKQVSTLNVVNGDIEYARALRVRDNACGTEGKLYEPEPNVALKEYKHNLKRYAFYIGYVVIYISLFAFTQIK